MARLVERLDLDDDVGAHLDLVEAHLDHAQHIVGGRRERRELGTDHGACEAILDQLVDIQDVSDHVVADVDEVAEHDQARGQIRVLRVGDRREIALEVERVRPETRQQPPARDQATHLESGAHGRAVVAEDLVPVDARFRGLGVGQAVGPGRHGGWSGWAGWAGRAGWNGLIAATGRGTATAGSGLGARLEARGGTRLRAAAGRTRRRAGAVCGLRRFPRLGRGLLARLRLACPGRRARQPPNRARLGRGLLAGLAAAGQRIGLGRGLLAGLADAGGLRLERRRLGRRLLARLADSGGAGTARAAGATSRAAGRTPARAPTRRRAGTTR